MGDEMNGVTGGGQGNPLVSALANMDTVSAKRMADSVYTVAPSESLATGDPVKKKKDGWFKRFMGWEGGIEQTIVRGGADSIHNIASLYARTAGNLSHEHQAGFDKALGITRTADEQQQLDENYLKLKRDGLEVTRKMVDALGPEKENTVNQLIHGITQFIVGRKILPGMGKGVVAEVVHNGMADALAFDPHAERIANEFVNAPGYLGDAARLLAMHPDDDESTAYFRMAAEGYLMGKIIDKAVGGIKGLAKKGKAKLAERFTPEAPVKPAPKLADYMPVKDEAGESILSKSENWTLGKTDDGQFRPEPVNEAAKEAAEQMELPAYDTPEEAMSRVVSLNLAGSNVKKPQLDITPEQHQYLRDMAKWIHETGQWKAFQDGGLSWEAGAGARDVNFRYDLSPEQYGHIISSMSTVLRSELEAARIPQSLMRDAKGGKHISNAETLAKAVQDFNGATPDVLQGTAHSVADAVDEAPATLLATRILRVNLAQQVEQLTRALDVAADNNHAAEELTKATNALINTFALESRLKSGGGRFLQSMKMMVAKAGAKVSKKALGRALGGGKYEPLDVLHFKFLDDALTPEEASQMDSVAERDALEAAKGEHADAVERTTGAKPAKTKVSNKPAVEGMDVPVNPEKAKANKTKGSTTPEEAKAHGAGPNTYTLIDEAEAKIAAADEALAKAEESSGVTTPKNDQQVSKAVEKDATRIDAARRESGVNVEDIRLARERLAAMRSTLAERKKAGSKVVDLSDYTKEELDDVATMHAERVKKLAEEQRTNPLTARREKVVYMTKDQLRAMARNVTYVPRTLEEQADMLDAILGLSKKAAEVEGADLKPSLWQKWVHYRAISMLSSPKTGVVNFMSAVSQALYRPMEGYVGALANKSKEDQQFFHDTLIGTLHAYSEAWKMAVGSYKAGQGILAGVGPIDLPQHSPFDQSSAMVRGFMNALGMTSKFMTAGDEFAQQLAYRGNVFAQSMREARNAKLTGDELAAYIKNDLEQAFTEDKRGINPAALSYAKDVTLRRELGDKTFGGKLENAARDVPFMRLLFPFVRIPVNLVRYQMDRAPVLGMLSARNVEDWKAGGIQRSEVMGRQIAGTMMWTSGLILAGTGIITGAGPTDPDLRKTWLGPDGKLHQPYSIKIGDEWVSYRRFEPLSTPLGIMADFVQMVGEMDEGGGKDAEKIFESFAAGVGQNLLSKTYLKSASDLFYALGSGQPGAMRQFLSSMAGSFIPTVLTSADWDDQLRDTQSIVQDMKARIPGLSLTLEPRRNLFGEKVMKPAVYWQRAFNPYTINSAKADEVDVELFRIGEQMSMPGPRKFGVNLKDRSLGINNQSPYDRWMELMGESKNGEPTLRERLRTLVKSDEYKTKMTDGANGFPGSRLLAVEKIVRTYRAKAFAQMLNENKTLKDAIIEQAKAKGMALAADPDVAEALSGNFSGDSGEAGSTAAAMGISF